MKENEHLYLNFKAKYEEAIELVNSLSEEKEKLKYMLQQSNKRKRLIFSSGKSTSKYDNNLSESRTEENEDCEEEKRSERKDVIGSVESENVFPRSNTNVSEFNIINEKMVPLSDYDKLKEDYMNLFTEKNRIASELSEIVDSRQANEKLLAEMQTMKEYNDSLKDHISRIESDDKILHEQIDKLVSDKEDLNAQLKNIREKLKISENEKTEIKIKNAHHFSKFKLMEKEISQLKKKNNELNRNVKCLIEKIGNDKEDKIELKKAYERKIQDLENKIEKIEDEKKKMSKDVLATLIENTMKKQNLVTFMYDNEKNIIAIKYAGEIIGEVNNETPHSNKNEDKTELNENINITKCLSYKSNNNSPFTNLEASVCHYRQLTNAQKYNNKSSNKKFAINSPNKNVSLRKLFSNNNFSISSRKSLVDSLDKENCNINNINLNLISLNPNSFAEKLADDHSQIQINKFNNNEISLTNCINQINIDKEAKKVSFEIQKENFEIDNIKKDDIKVVPELKQETFEVHYIIKQSKAKKCDDILSSHLNEYQNNFVGNEKPKKFIDIIDMETEKSDIDYNSKMKMTVETSAKDEEEKKIKRGTCCQCIIL